MTEEVVLNNRDELIKWLFENHKKLNSSNYISKIEFKENWKVILEGGSENGGFNKTVTFPVGEKFNHFPINFNYDPTQDLIWGYKIFDIKNGWLLEMIMKELKLKQL